MSSYATEPGADQLKAQLRALQTEVSRLERERGGAEVDAMRRAQTRADGVAAMFGEQVPSPTLTDDPLSYRRRLLTKFQQYSPKYKDARFNAAYDEPSVAAAERVVYADAVEAAHNGAATKPGVLVAEHKYDEAGRRITTWHGDWCAAFGPFMTGGQVGHVIRPRGKAPGS